MILLIAGMVLSLGGGLLGLALKHRGLLSRNSGVGTILATCLMCGVILWLYNSPSVQNAQLPKRDSEAANSAPSMTEVLFPDVDQARALPAVDEPPAPSQLTQITDAYSAETTVISDAELALDEPQEAPDFTSDIETHLLNEDFQAALRTLKAMTERAGPPEARIRNALEQLALEKIRPLPAAQRAQNYNGYLFLSALRPEEALYLAKVERYSQ